MIKNVLISIGLLYGASPAIAQNFIDEISNYSDKVQARRISPLDVDTAFGSNISYLDGSTRFSNVDISIPGNSSLEVELRRTRAIDERYLTTDARIYAFGAMYDWSLDVPYMEGTFSSQGWVVGPSNDPQRYARCTRQQKPYMVLTGDFHEEKMWGGYSLNLPGQGGKLLLKAASGIPMPEDGRSYPWVAEGDIRLTCLAQLANGQPGEGFIALDGQGLTYTFDTLIARQMANFRMRSYHSVDQYKIYIAASKVEDRNGNWVRYNYENGVLTSITASDGRSIALNYSNGRLTSASTNGRTWTYRYREPGVTEDGGLSEVILPDGTQWSYNWTGSLRPARMPAPQEGDTPCDMIVGRVQGPYKYAIGHPAGATAAYGFEYKTMLRSNLDACAAPVQPNYYSLWSVTERTISGPGIPGDRTTFEISPAYPSEPIRWSKVTGPDGSSTQYGYGRTYRVDEGKLLRQITRAADGSVLQEISNNYHSTPPSGAPYAPRIGDSLHFMQAADGLTQPLWKTTTTREETDYSRESVAWDSFARSTEATSRGPSGTRRDTFTFHDNRSRWIVGNLASTIDTESGETISSTQFDALGRPEKKYSFGLLTVSLTYNPDGTVSSASDATDRTTRFERWHRGTPRSVINPDGTTQQAAVDDNGWLNSITDENGFTTSYAYDSMGRPRLMQPPADGTMTWTPTVTTLVKMTSAESGIPAGHWKQTESIGNGKRVTYLDALWRPVLDESFDAEDRSGTLSQVFRRFDHENRLIFESYPGRYR